jgi:hypothetical protein
VTDGDNRRDAEGDKGQGAVPAVFTVVRGQNDLRVSVEAQESCDKLLTGVCPACFFSWYSRIQK